MPADKKKVMRELPLPSLEQAKSTHPADYIDGKVSTTSSEVKAKKSAPIPPKPPQKKKK